MRLLLSCAVFVIATAGDPVIGRAAAGEGVPKKPAARIGPAKPASGAPKRPKAAFPAAVPTTPAAPAADARPPRDVRPVADTIDRRVDEKLRALGIPASQSADDAEFLRRVTIDITGRIPTYDEAAAFLADDRPDKRSRLIDDLLARPSYGRHFAAIWSELIAPPDTSSKKSGNEAFPVWLAAQFNANRGWNAIVTDLLTVEGLVRESPQAGFVLGNSENSEPQANLLADATARLFWGVQLRCAECHDHPFAPWKQVDFWGTAAFFSRLRKGYTDGKNPRGWSLTEAWPDEPVSQRFGTSMAAKNVAGPAIVVPETGGEFAARVIKARFLEGAEVDWADDGPYRARFAAWAAGKQNPWFARNAANRLWAHFFGRGFVNPLDEFHDGNPASHPELLHELASEFADSDFDLKHLVRCICNSRTYQRTSRPLPGNEADALFSHAAVRVMRPEVLYDSLSVVLYPPVPKGGSGKVSDDQFAALPEVSRDEFVRFFRSAAYQGSGSAVNQGIPQFLRLMNGPPLNHAAPGPERFHRSNRPVGQVLDDLFLAAYSRRPTREERERLTEYVAGQGDASTAYAGVLWALLNSSEFVLIH
jgi:hypothetical protein